MTDRANVVPDANKLKDFDKIWDGNPMHHFDRNWFLPFIVALGSIVMDGHSLRDTWNEVDPGANGGGTPAQNQHTLTRNRRIFAILINYIAKGCHISQYLQEEYDNEGIRALTYIRQNDIGNLPLSASDENELQKTWISMTLMNLNIKLSHSCIFEWGNHVRVCAKEFTTEKSFLEQYNKFMDGLPPQLQQKVIDERENPNTRFNIPANYAAPHPQQGNAHPNAGEKDIGKVISYFARVWNTLIKQGMVRLPEANKVDEPELHDANYVGGKGNPRMEQPVLCASVGC